MVNFFIKYSSFKTSKKILLTFYEEKLKKKLYILNVYKLHKAKNLLKFTKF